MNIVQNKWIEKERPKKKSEPKDTREPTDEPAKCHLNVSRANRTRTLRGVRK